MNEADVLELVWIGFCSSTCRAAHLGHHPTMTTTRSHNVGHNERRYRKLRLALRDRCMTDGIPCALCIEPFDWTITDPRHPRYFTVHHPIARAHGGAKDDPANMLPAHKRCNEDEGTGDRPPTTDPAPSDPKSETWP